MKRTKHEHHQPKRSTTAADAVTVDDKRGGLALLNQTNVRKEIVYRLRMQRGDYLADKLHRVSESSYSWLEAQVRNLISRAVDRLPTTGATIRLGEQ